MIRPLSFVLLLSASAIVLGQPLYKWVEPDGSITFSVKPPPAGVTFEQVDADKPSAASAKSSPEINSTRRAATESTPSNGPSMGEALPKAVQRQPLTQRVAPPLNSPASARTGIYRSTANGAAGEAPSNGSASMSVMGSATADPANTSLNDTGSKVALEARSRKQRQCEDLQKRVVSLERRLRSRLTPDDMDNTVIHMARYQRSYDQHCVQ